MLCHGAKHGPLVNSKDWLIDGSVIVFKIVGAPSCVLGIGM